MNPSSDSPTPVHRLLAMTVIGADHPGIVDRLARLIRDHDGNWLESRMARLGGQFAGIVAVRLPATAVDALQNDLNALTAEGLTVVVQPGTVAESPRVDSASPRLRLQLVSPDRPGILRELTGLLASHEANVEELSTRIVPAQFTGEPLFEASLRLALPHRDADEPLRQAIEALATDLALDLTVEQG